MKRFVFAAALAVFCLLALSCAADGAQPEGYTAYARSGALTLYADDAGEGIAVYDARSGETYFSSVPKAHYENAGRVNKTWQKYMASMFLLYYTPMDKPTGAVKAITTVGGDKTLDMSPIENGLSFKYTFPSLSISLELRLTLEDESLLCVIPQDSIREEGGYGITSIALLPFFLSAQDSDEGYYVYPNGSGELYRFKDKKLRANALYTLAMPVYTGRVVSGQNYPFDQTDAMQNNAMLPVFGAVRNKGGVAAVIEQGDADAAVYLAVGGVSVPVNRLYARLYYRSDYGVLGQEIFAGGKQVFSFVSRLADPQMRACDRAVRYLFLSPEQADYSGMACALRENLLARGVLTQSATLPGMVLDILCGVEYTRMVNTEFLRLTSFSQAVDMAMDSARDMVVNLKGWGSRGVLGYPYYFPASGALGGSSALSALAQKCAAADIPLLLQVNGVKLKKNTGGFSTTGDVARDGNDFVYEIDRKDTFYLSSAARLERLRASWLSQAAALGVSGLTWEDAGTYLYDDESAGGMQRAAMADFYGSLLADTRKTLGVSAVEGGSAYALSGADILREIPENSTLYYFGDESIPLYQMIVHGSVSYTGQPVNVFYDETRQTLQMLEYGYTPCFELAYQSNGDLIDTDYNMVFSLTYQTWKERIGEMAALSEETKSLRALYMVRHERLTKDVSCVLYSDGSRLYVNYASQAYDSPHGTVDAGGYLLVKGESAL